VDSSIWKQGSEIWGMRSTDTCCSGGTGSVSGSGWTKTGGEILEKVNGRVVKSFAVYYI